jgi:fimbrial chaperone protein
MRLLLAAPVLLALAVAAGVGSARAAEVEVNPVLVSLSPGTRSALIAVRNVGTEPARFELQARTWSQSADGEMLLGPTEDLAVFPPMLTLAPGEQRNIRIGAVASAGPVEKTYRVFLQELGPPERQEGPAQVRVLSRIGLPVFLTPAQARDRTLLRDVSVRGGKLTFRLVNEGTAYVRPTSVKVVASGEDGAPRMERELAAWYILAGGQRDYEVEIPRDVCAAVRSVMVTAALGRDVIRSELAVPTACNP